MDPRDLMRAASAHIERLRTQHKAGINPTLADIDDLFDYGERLGRAALMTEPPLTCSIAQCGRPAEERIADRAYCGRCGRALRQVTADLAKENDQLARVRVEAMQTGRVPWPSPHESGSREAGGAR